MRDATSVPRDGEVNGSVSPIMGDLVFLPDSSQGALEPLFSAQIEDRDGVRHIEVSGEIDLAVKDEFAAALDAPQIRIDLSQVTFIDSQGLGCLLEAKARLQERMFVTGLSPSVERLLEIAGVDEEFNETA